MRKELRLDKLRSMNGNCIRDCVYQIHALITDLKGGWTYWDCLESRGRKKLKEGIESIIVSSLLNSKLKRAIALDVLDEKGIPRFESEVYKLLKKEWYKGDVGRLVRDMIEWSSSSIDKESKHE